MKLIALVASMRWMLSLFLFERHNRGSQSEARNSFKYSRQDEGTYNCIKDAASYAKHATKKDEGGSTSTTEVTEKELENPQPAMMGEVYERFVELLLGISREEMHQPQFNLIKELDYPELYDEACGQVLFITSLMKLMKIVGVEEFNLNTLIKPNKKTRKYMSGLINYAKFHEAKISAVTELAAETDNLLEQRNSLDAEINQLDNEIAQAKEEKERDAPILEEMNRDYSENLEKLKLMNKKTEELTEIATKEKENVSGWQKKVKEQKEAMVRLREEVKQLEAQIVTSPDTTVSTLEKIRNETNTEKAELTEDYKKVKVLNYKKGELAKISRDLDRCLQAVLECSNIADRIQLVSEEKENVKNEIYNKMQKRDELKRAIAVLKDHIVNKKKAIERADRNHNDEVKRRKAFEKKARANLQLEETRKIENQGKLEKKKEELKVIYEEVERLKTAHKKDMEHYRRLYLSIVDKFEKYVFDITAEIERDAESIDI